MAKLVDVGSIGSYFESLSDPAPHAQSQAPAGRYRRHRRLRHHLRLRWTHRHPSLGQASGLLAGPAPRPAQRHPLARLHPPPAHGAEARGLPTLLPGLDLRRDPGRRRRTPPSRRHRRQDLSRLARRGQGPRRPAHRQRLGQRGGHRAGPGRHRRQVQRDHGHPATPGADRPGRHAHHDRRDGLPEGHRRADRRRRRRLRHRRQGQPAEARWPRSRRSSSTTWNATWRTSGIGATRPATTGTAASTNGPIISPRCRAISRRRRTGRG